MVGLTIIYRATQHHEFYILLTSKQVLYSVDIKTKVPSQYRLLILKRNFQFDVNRI